MHAVTAEQLVTIEHRMALAMIEIFGSDISALALDITNFATYIDSTNEAGTDRSAGQGQAETRRPAPGRARSGRHPRRRRPAGLPRLPRQPARRHPVHHHDRPADEPLHRGGHRRRPPPPQPPLKSPAASPLERGRKRHQANPAAEMTGVRRPGITQRQPRPPAQATRKKFVGSVPPVGLSRAARPARHRPPHRRRASFPRAHRVLTPAARSTTPTAGSCSPTQRPCTPPSPAGSTKPWPRPPGSSPRWPTPWPAAAPAAPARRSTPRSRTDPQIPLGRPRHRLPADRRHPTRAPAEASTSTTKPAPSWKPSSSANVC